MVTPADDLESLSTEQLRERAFARAERHHDLRFFWNLVKELPSTQELQVEGGDIGQLPAALGDLVGIVRELLGRSPDADAVLRQYCLGYLEAHPGD